MRYLLAVLTHGASEPLAETLRSFRERVSPAPVGAIVYADGHLFPDGADLDPLRTAASIGVPAEAGRVIVSTPRGFCAATAALWGWATDGRADLPAYDYVFWLEHDFRFLRAVDLRELAAVLDGDPLLAQMALCRGPVNEQEIAAGGLVASRPGEFEERWTCRTCGTAPGNKGWWCDLGCGRDYNQMLAWLEHRSFFTTNPSLMRRDFMVENPWPDYPDQCEGRFGIDLVADGYRFGFWGGGKPWVEHVGVRTGFGY